MAMESGSQRLIREEEEEYQESLKSKERKRLGIKKPKDTSFPTKGENKSVSLSNSNYKQFPYEVAKKVSKTRHDLWRRGISASSSPLSVWSDARQGSQSPKVVTWVRRRERYAKKNINGKLTPSRVMSLMKYGLVHESGLSTMMKVVGLSTSGAILKDTKLRRGSESKES